jgi:hypothetical protein
MSQFAFHQQGASASPEVLTFFFWQSCSIFLHLTRFLMQLLADRHDQTWEFRSRNEDVAVIFLRILHHPGL